MDAATRADALERRLAATATAVRLMAVERLAAARARLARGQPADRILDAVEQAITGGEAACAARAQTPLAITYPESLPVSGRRDEILASLRAAPVLVLTGETGSGKTTQLPKLLLECGYGRRGLIAVTQPRRVAAVSIAARLAEELEAPLGAVVHSVRFDDRSDERTLIRVMTDGLLLAEASSDPLFSRYDAILLDEAHERGLNTDLLLGLLRRARERRPELAVVVSSASIAAERFAAFFHDAPVIQVAGRTFPVEIRWQPPGDDEVGYLDAAVRTVRDLHQGPSGDILVFLPTERDILEASRRLDEPAMTVLPLFGRLTPGEQQRIFAPARGRKVVLSTNIAETSLTIPGIRFVVDAGLSRMKRYQPSTRTERLPVEAVSQASAVQRAGRAGRVEAGVCVRLYAEDDFARREPFTPPEILRSNLAGVALTCLHMGIPDPAAFPWMDAPAPHAWAQAFAQLDELGALTDEHHLTPLGTSIAQLPCDPQVGRILIAGLTGGCPHECATIAAFLSVQDPRVRPLGQESKADAAHRALAHEAGDLATVLRLWSKWEAAESNSRRARLCEELYLGHRRMREWADVRHQLWGALRERAKGELPHASADEAWPLERIHHAVLAGMLGHVLMWDAQEKAYRGAGDRLLAVHPGSALRSGKQDDGKKSPPPAPWLVACEVVETSRLFARLCAPIDPRWVEELAGPRVRRRHRDPHWHPQRSQVVCVETVTWKGLPIRDGRLIPYERVDPADATRIFAEQALAGESDIGVGVADANRRLFALVEGLRHRLRDPGVHPDRAVFASASQARLGDAVVASTHALKAWISERGEDALRLTLADLIDPELARRADGGFPEWIDLAGERIALRYRYHPGDLDDGVTLELTQSQAERLDLGRLDGLVPGWCEEQVQALLETLPKDDRRRLIPLADSARELAAQVRPELGRVPLVQLVAHTLAQRHGIRARPDAAAIPDWLRPRIVVRDHDGRTVVQGRDHELLAAQLGAAIDRLKPLRRTWDTPPAPAWPGACPGAVELHGVRGWVGLARDRDATGCVAARRAVYGSEGAWRAWHRDGFHALLEATLGDALTGSIAGTLDARCQRIAGCSAGFVRRGLLLSAALAAAGRPVADRAAWELALEAARNALAKERGTVDALLPRWLDRLEQIQQRLKQGARNLGAARLNQCAAQGVQRLLPGAALARLPWEGLRRVDLYLDGWLRRLDHAQRAPGDAQRLAERGDHLLAVADEAADPRRARLIAALDLTPAARDLHLRLEECMLALSATSPGSGLGQAEAMLRARAQDVGKAVETMESRCASLSGELKESSVILARHPAGPARERLSAQLDKFLRGFPDWSLGCDLSVQEAEGRALLLRIRKP